MNPHYQNNNPAVIGMHMRNKTQSQDQQFASQFQNMNLYGSGNYQGNGGFQNQNDNQKPRTQSQYGGNCMENITCPHKNCNQKLQVNKQKERAKDSFHMIEKCLFCERDIHYFPCKCGSLIILDQKPIQGYLYKCPNQQNCNIKQLQLFKCGKPGCGAINLFTGNYKMGDFLKCCQCQVKFQQVGCPHCHNSMYFLEKAPYKTGVMISCYLCQKNFQHFNCFSCNQPQYSKNKKFSPFESQKCQNCNYESYFLQCPSCFQPNYRSKFSPFVIDNCQACHKYFQYYDCPKCGKENQSFAQYKGMDNSQKQCYHCFYQFSVHQCVQCQEKVIFPQVDKNDIYNNTKIQVKCSKCKTNQLSIQCIGCSSQFGEKNINAEKSYCKTCNTENKLQNGKGTSVLSGNQQKLLQSTVNQDIFKKDEQNEEANEEKEKLLCKICIFEKANHIFKSCGHLVCCESCIKDMKGICPLCRQKGDYMKIYF